MKDYICYHNGEWKRESEVCISFKDLGFQRAYGVFDYLRTYQHKPFQKDWHAKKIIQSLRNMNLETKLSESLFLELLYTLFVKNSELLNPHIEYGVKTMITGGVDGKETFLMYLEEFDDRPFQKMRKEGICLLTYREPRHSAESKNIDYKTLFKAQKEIQAKGCLEILHRGDSYVYESGTGNIFMVKDGVLITPKERVYAGSTRDFVLELAKEESLPVEERFIPWKEFMEADEVFITASKKEILPVTKIIDDKNILEFKIGKITQQLIELFEEEKNTKCNFVFLYFL